MQAYSEMRSFIDWDFFKKPVVVRQIQENDNLPTGEKEILIQRDSEYNLQAHLLFNDYNFLNKYFQNRNNGVIGSIVEGFQIKGFTSEYFDRHY